MKSNEWLNCSFIHLSEKLNVDVDTVHHGVEGLMYLLTESSKLMVSTHKIYRFTDKRGV